MATFFIKLIVLLFLQNPKKSNSATLDDSECPTDCICYPEYLSNLASWKWIESEINLKRDDPEHEAFNPYTEHNEVVDNPVATKKRMNEGTLKTVTCIIRSKLPLLVSKTLASVPPSTQVLSLLQAPGSKNITLENQHFEKLHSLVGLEIQGYVKSVFNQDTFGITADAFSNLKNLVYLNLENVVIHQRSVENQLHHSTRKIISVNYTIDENSIDNEVQSHLLVLPTVEKIDDNVILPYNLYKTESKEHNVPTNHPIPIEPKTAVAFTNLPNLIHLRISGCNMQDISWDMFYKLQNLKFLLLERNDLLFLPDFVFYATPNLTALSLAGNRILSLQTVGLAGLLYLQKLDVTHNNITHLSELSLPPFPHLEVADFRYNPIEAIFPNTFEVMNTTKTLYLGNPSIPMEFFPNSFFGLISLKNLEISNVQIGFLERPMLKGMPQLRSLTMQGTITRISYDAFSEVPQLEKLILKKCSISKISMDALYGLSSLLELDLSYNQLHFLPPGLFDEQTSLREVNLQHNQLKTLPPNLFKKIPAKMIRLEGNAWHCSCDMTFWNSAVINQVKRFYIYRNETFCKMNYDKGSMCQESGSEPTFQVKYVYEKRVSPVCETPKKFAKRSVFEVLRKELRYCQSLNHSMNALQSNKIQKLSAKISYTNNTTGVLSKQLQKQLLFAKPVKVKKPPKPENFTLNNIIPIPKLPMLSSTAVTLNDITKVSEATISPSRTTLHETLTETSQNFRITSVPEKSPSTTPHPHISNSPRIETRTQQPAVQTPTQIKPIPRPSISKPVKPSRTTPAAVNLQSVNNNPDNVPAISRKALKLAKLHKMQRNSRIRI